MALTAYCKKCGRDVSPGEVCPCCGGKLGRNAERVAWCVDHTPVRDWMTWNAAMRIILPVGALVLVLILLLELMMGGVGAVEYLLRNGLIYTLLGLVLVTSALLLLGFILQGDDVLDCVADSKGVHVQQYLPDPTPIKLLLRLRSPALLRQMAPDEHLLLIGQKELAWKDVARVQLWPEKTMVLFYAPSWWMRVYLPCTPFTYPEVLAFVSDRIGTKKAVILPDSLRVEKPKAAPRRSQRTRQMTMDDLTPRTQPVDDYADLTDVLGEIRAMNNADTQPPEE